MHSVSNFSGDFQLNTSLNWVAVSGKKEDTICSIYKLILQLLLFNKLFNYCRIQYLQIGIYHQMQWKYAWIAETRFIFEE